ncbi:MAG TPA: PAS domain S-box protein [Gaiellaceae bacterium]|nr:PAS domain S-box protein [Gaiellaceae bacterium]
MTSSGISADSSVEPTADRFKELLDTIEAIVSEYDLRTARFTYISGHAERILGYPPELLENDGWRTYVDEDDERLIDAAIEQGLQDGADYSYEHRMRTADGRRIWLHVSASVVPDALGEPALIRTVSLDITLQKEAEAERERSRALLQATLDSTGDAICVVDLENHITVSNRAFAELWPIPQQLLDARDRETISARVLERLAEPDEFVRRWTEIDHDRTLVTSDIFGLVDGRTIERHTTPQWLGGEIVGRVWTFRDITERVAAQGVLRESEQRNRDTLENIGLVAAGIDAHGMITFANDALLELTGWSREEVVGHDWFDLFDDNPYVRADFLAQMDLGTIRPHFEGAIRTRSGERREIAWSSTLQHDESDAVAGITTLGEDVTERHQADALLRSREELFRSLIENATDVITILSADGTSLYESPSVERLLGWKPEELVGRPKFALLHPDNLEHVEPTFAAIVAGEEPGPIEFRLRHRDGSWRMVEAIGRRRRQDGEWVVVVNYRDVTDQRQLQEQLMHSQKLEAVGRLAGGIAHDFNNLLTAIGGYSEFLVAGFDADDPRREDALEIARASDRAAALTRQLLAFSRRQVLLEEVLDMGEIVTGLENLLSRLLGGSVELSTSVAPGCRVRGDRGQFEQVVTNLALNARDAMPAGGTVEFGVHCHDGEVELTVRDSGVGMDPETIAHCFEPFFSTKGPGKGTGLGLATVYGIVTQSGGGVSVTSAPGEGSTFRVVLPLSPDDATVPIERDDRPQERTGSEGVLLAEDEETIRRLVREVLSRSGYEVFAAASGDEALRLLEENGDRIDLLLTDVVMPGMSGPDLARAASRFKPSLRVLFTSGYTSEPDEAFDDPDVAFIGKPFSPQALVAKVRDVLDAG